MARVKYPEVVMIGISRKYGVLTPEVLASEEWRKDWYELNVIAAQRIGATPKKDDSKAV